MRGSLHDAKEMDHVLYFIHPYVHVITSYNIKEFNIRNVMIAKSLFLFVLQMTPESASAHQTEIKRHFPEYVFSQFNYTSVCCLFDCYPAYNLILFF